ncbi:MAG: urease accessory protein UreD [Alphaproteobacteria bacterium]|nr:urease accessory protein UreD [Alphaproteobacteria bacterium]
MTGGKGNNDAAGSLPTPRGEDAARPQRAEGSGRVVAKLRGGATRLTELFQEGSAKIRLPRPTSQALEAVLMNTAGGLTGGDRFDWTVEAGPGAEISVTTPACERVYKSAGGAATIANRLVLGPGAHIDWLPQETILFEQSRLQRHLDAELGEGATLTALEAVLLGREAMGEAARSAMLDDQWRISRGGRLIHAEANRLSATDLERDALSLLAGNNAFATLVHIADNAEDRLAAVRALIPAEAKAAASAVGERLVVRILAPSGLALRRLVTPLLVELSAGRALPRLWST